MHSHPSAEYVDRTGDLGETSKGGLSELLTKQDCRFRRRPTEETCVTRWAPNHLQGVFLVPFSDNNLDGPAPQQETPGIARTGDPLWHKSVVDASVPQGMSMTQRRASPVWTLHASEVALAKTCAKRSHPFIMSRNPRLRPFTTFAIDTTPYQHQAQMMLCDPQSPDEAGSASHGPELVAATVNVGLYILSMVLVRLYFNLKTFSCDLLLTKITVILLTVVSSLQAIFSFLCFYDFSRYLRKKTPNPLTLGCCQLHHRFTHALERGNSQGFLKTAQHIGSEWAQRIFPRIMRKHRSLLYADASTIISSTALVCEVTSCLSLSFLMKEKRKRLVLGNPLREFIDKVVRICIRKVAAIRYGADATRTIYSPNHCPAGNSAFTIAGALLHGIFLCYYPHPRRFRDLEGSYPSLNARKDYGHLVLGRFSRCIPATQEQHEGVIIAAGMHGMRLEGSVVHSNSQSLSYGRQIRSFQRVKRRSAHQDLPISDPAQSPPFSNFAGSQQGTISFGARFKHLSAYMKEFLRLGDSDTGHPKCKRVRIGSGKGVARGALSRESDAGGVSVLEPLCYISEPRRAKFCLFLLQHEFGANGSVDASLPLNATLALFNTALSPPCRWLPRAATPNEKGRFSFITQVG
ncbi:hypothetical protein FA13DRAFT_1709760 [Coprinellus micaceus]|uniref:Uncharacterized protein n=1 Tax=Coprinellus micaceus TaxID=71717 RepID=A0A4Y7TCR4_COPMI|nr:hypothetical protein FA13DRAFT_1709760 [Coprinellus micaceus]